MENEEEIDIKEIIIGLWKRKWIILIVTIISFLLGYLMYGRTTTLNSNSQNDNEELYVAETTFLVINEERVQQTSSNSMLDTTGVTVPTNSTVTNQNRITVDGALFSTFSDILTSKTVLNKVISDLELDTSVLELKENIAISRTENSNLLKIYVNYNDEETALEISNMLTENLIQEMQKTYNISGTIVDEAEILDEDELKALSEDLEDENMVIKTVTSQKGSPKKVIMITLVGFIFVCGIIVVIELFDNTIKNQSSLEKLSKLKNLTTLKSANDEQNSFRLLRVNINECKNILITSPDNKSGKSYVATNLAESFAKLNKKVLLIDLTKNESELIKKYEGQGLSDFLDGQDKFVEKYAVETSVKNLSILLAGKKLSNMTELLESPKMVETLSTIERLYDVVIIDSANVLESANTLAMAKIAKYSILVCGERKTKIDDLIKAKTNIEDVGGNVIGTVLNKISK